MNILVFILSFLFMEYMAWFTHKYVMHGFLWNLHQDHHIPGKSFFEKNDYFFVIFAVPAIVCFILGALNSTGWLVAIGSGITTYGLCYFLVHDVFIHQRFKWFRNSDNVYFRAIRRAHKMHHKHIHKEDGECFGMLLVPFKYIKAEIFKSKKVGHTRN
ncbi:MAG: sterol desaturase family protein [Bacteroidia bacterium]